MYTEEVAAKLKTVHGNPNISHWSLDHGYESDVNENGYPHRVFSTNPRRSLRCHLSVNTDDQFVCKKGLGYQVFLNVPGEVIHTRSFPINIQFSRREIIRVKPKLITTTENLRNYAPNQRQCFFDSERRLRFLKLYTQNNCEAECLANYTKSVCGCVKFHMPRDEDTKICGAASITCYATAEWNLYGDDIIVGMKDQDARKFRENCNCLPACHHIAYDASFAAGRALGDISDKMVSEVIVLFREPQIITLQRTPLYTLTDFLAACGGLLGLFLGISALSVVEFVYYFTLRLFWTFRQSRDNHFSVNISLQQERIKSISIDIPNY
ncbi:pickpocket protein 28-like [Contarinia nasturtii]|uniref:pickpocket protein 28-like n=1 Tax=Contarinia nasturtii TaxID=265458 RepID=UPI0012D4BD3D|nr:pickpocket protein 28-like [Contarinia nasturtii]